MTDSSLMGCAACVAVPDVKERAEKSSEHDVMISVPGMHCAACMSKIETALEHLPNVARARANLSLKRVTIQARGDAQASDFLPTILGLGYEAYELDEEMVARKENDASRSYLLRLGVTGFAMMNVMLLSVAVWTGAEASTRDLLHWVSAMIAVPAAIYGAQPFFRNAWSALRAGGLNMDVPISLAIILALGMSVYETSQSGENAYFDAALSLTFFLLIGRYLDYRTRSMARSAAQELAALETQKTTRVHAEGDQVVHVRDVQIGDELRIFPGTRVPVDGVIMKGQSDVGTALISGESMPEVMKQGDQIRAGMLNLTGMLIMRAEVVGEDTSLQRISRMVAIAENGRNVYTSLADRAARIYAPVVHLLALIAFIGWFGYAGDWHFAMNVAIAVLVITCPCALGLAVPAVNTASSGRLFQKGILLKSETTLERLANVDVAIFDKTGTLTEDTQELAKIEGKHLDIALALAEASHHPLSAALSEALRERNVKSADVSEIKEIAGSGMEGQLDGKTVRLGRAEFVGQDSHSLASEVWLKFGKELTRFEFQDHLRDGVNETIERFQDVDCRVVLLSGDRGAVVENLAKRIGISEFHAKMLPEEKAEFVRDLKSQGHHVLMVGDGLNDTIALTEANISMAPGSALDAARMASDIVILNSNFEVIFEAYQVSKSAKRRILENFTMAGVYNVIAVPIALMGFATPFLAALAMSTSSILVVLNANRLRWKS